MLDTATAELVRGLRDRPDVAGLLTEPDLSPGTAPVIDIHFDIDGADARFFSVVSTIGTPIDVTAQELRVEAFFPADDATRALGQLRSATAGVLTSLAPLPVLISGQPTPAQVG